MNNTKQHNKTASVPAKLAARHTKLRQELQARELDAFIISNAPDVRYLIDLPGDDSYVIFMGNRLIVVTDSRYSELLQPVKKWAKLELRQGSMAAKIGEIINSFKNIHKVGLQSEHLSVNNHKALAKEIGGKKCKNTTSILDKIRAVKDQYEIKTICKAIKIQLEALTATLADLKIGQSELEVSARLKYEMEILGASGPSFPPIVAAQANSSMPHYYPSPKSKITVNKPLLIDWGALYEGYCSDLTRTWAIGSMSKKIREIYKIVLDAQLASIAAIKPGAKCIDVDYAARKVIKDAGYGDKFGHGLGHGIGLVVHEQPGLGPRAAKNDILLSGMVVTVEPGIYIPGTGGVRIEDDVLVTEKGYRVLSDYPKNIDSAILL